MEERKQFTFYGSFYYALREVEGLERLALYEALTEYALFEKTPELYTPALRLAFQLIKPNLDASRKKAVAGQRGGKANRKQEKSKREKENEIENEIETEDDCLWREGFEKFWNAFPVKIGKDKAAQIWQTDLPDTDTVCHGLERWKKSQQWNRENKRFIPRAAKFLEEKHYLQIPEDARPKGVEGHMGQAELEAIAKVMRQGN